MIDCVISMEDETASLDLRGSDLDFPDAERLLEALEPYAECRQIKRVIVDVRGHEVLPAPVEILLMGLHQLAHVYGSAVEVRSGPTSRLAAAALSR